MNAAEKMFSVEIRLFAAAKQALGHPSVAVELPESADVGRLRQAMGSAFPELANLLPHCRFAVNTAYVDESTRLNPGDEIACIPPVSGG